MEATLLDFGLAERHTGTTRQMDDINELTSVALQALPGRRELSDVRWALQGVQDLEALEELLHTALRLIGEEEGG